MTDRVYFNLTKKLFKCFSINACAILDRSVFFKNGENAARIQCCYLTDGKITLLCADYCGLYEIVLKDYSNCVEWKTLSMAIVEKSTELHFDTEKEFDEFMCNLFNI